MITLRPKIFELNSFGHKTFRQKRLRKKDVKITVCLIIAAISNLVLEKDPPSLTPIQLRALIDHLMK